MPQLQMPFFPQGITHINNMLAFSKENGRIAYVTGGMQLYTHEENDSVSFRMITAQFCANGITKQAEIASTFGVPTLAVKRAVKLFRSEGTRGFYKPRKVRCAAVLTAEVCVQVQSLMDSGMAVGQAAEQCGIKRDTLSKAVRSGRLRAPARVLEAQVHSTKSERSELDSEAAMGMGASNVDARVAASLGAWWRWRRYFRLRWMCPARACCLRCRHCWRWACSMGLRTISNCPMGTMGWTACCC